MEHKRLEALDGLRGIAALGVLIFHYIYHYNFLYGHSFDVNMVFKLGLYGVHLFFMISGFVIYWTLSRSHNVKEFVWSRFSRLYPVYWAALIITFVVVSILSLEGREQSFNTFLANFLMFHEYLGYGHVDGVYWTLSLELAFYFWMALIFLLGQQKRMEGILLVWLVLAFGVKISGLNDSIPEDLQKFILFEYIHLFAAGICFYRYKTKIATLYTHLVLALSLISVFIHYHLVVSIVVCSFYIVFFLIMSGKSLFLNSRVLVYFGSISYALYLVHQNIGYVIIQRSYEYNAPFIGLGIAVGMSVVIAHLLTRYIEKPALQYLRNSRLNNSTYVTPR